MLTEDQKRMARFALERMFTSERHFSICTIDNVLEMAGRKSNQGGNAYRQLRLLHCVNWKDIPPDILERVPSWINEVLGGPQLSVRHIAALYEGNIDQPVIDDRSVLPLLRDMRR